MSNRRLSPTKTELKIIKNVGKKIREIRVEQGLTLEMMEEKGFPSWRNLSEIENGKNCTLLTLIRISKCLNIPISELFQK